MQYVELVAIAAVIQYLFFGFMTGRARAKTGIEAPAISGHEDFERMYRVQVNSLEMLVAFLPALFIAGKYWPAWIVAGAGIIYIIGRFVYWRAYIAEPSKRVTGFLLSLLPTFLLVVLALIGAIMSLISTSD